MAVCGCVSSLCNNNHHCRVFFLVYINFGDDRLSAHVTYLEWLRTINTRAVTAQKDDVFDTLWEENEAGG